MPRLPVELVALTNCTVTLSDDSSASTPVPQLMVPGAETVLAVVLTVNELTPPKAALTGAVVQAARAGSEPPISRIKLHSSNSFFIGYFLSVTGRAHR